jgi:hypothetical protein
MKVYWGIHANISVHFSVTSPQFDNLTMNFTEINGVAITEYGVYVNLVSCSSLQFLLLI